MNLYPKSGYKFRESDGTTIVGQSWPGVIARVKAYRKRNNMPAGDPTNEVHEQACVKNPSLCSERTADHDRAFKKASLKSRVLLWFSSLLKRKQQEQQLALVSEQDAKHRQDICIGCPMREQIQDGCQSCKKAVAEFRNTLIPGRKHNPNSVFGCMVLGEELQTSIHLDEQTVDNSELPNNCWRKRKSAP